MQSIIEFNSIIFIGVLNIIIYFIGFLNTITVLIWNFTTETVNLELKTDTKNSYYLNIYRTILIVLFFAMIIISIKMIKGFMKVINDNNCNLIKF